MTGADRYNRPGLRPVPPLTDRQQMASERSLRLIRGYESRTNDDDLDAVLRAVMDTPRLHAITNGGRYHEATVDEHGIAIANCIRCDGGHFTHWDRIVIDRERIDGEQHSIYIARWPCPTTETDIEHHITEGDTADATESGAELTPAADNALRFSHLTAQLRHPASGGSPEGGDVA